MTTVSVNVTDVAGAYGPNDKIVFYSPVYREGTSGEIISTAETVFSLQGGPGTVELEPGPVRVKFQVQGIADTKDKEGVVPDEGEVDLYDVIGGNLTYTPPVVDRILDIINASTQSINWNKGHVPLDTTSISDLTPGSWAVSNDTRAGIIGAPGGRLGNLEMGSIGTSRTATFISQGTASEKPGMWVQAEHLGVWSGWQRIDGKAESVHNHVSDDITDAVSSIAYTPNRVVKTNAEGKLFISTASITEQGDPTNKAYVDARALAEARSEVAKIVGTAPETFDTLGEIADELASNESERAALTNMISEKADTSYVDAADTALGQRIDAEKWRRGWIPVGTDLNSLTAPGIHESSLGSVSRSLLNAPSGFVNPGTVEIKVSGDQVYQNIWSGSGGDLKSWRRMMDGNGWHEWEDTSPNAVSMIVSGTVLSTLTRVGDYLSPTASVSTSIPDTPSGMGGKPFTLRVKRSSATNLVQELTLLPGGSDSTPRTWQRGIAGAVITDWLEVGTGPLLSQLAPQTGRKEMLKQASRLRRGGVVGTSGKTPVALSFDHGLTNFRDLVLPHLVRLGLPCTLALNPDDFGKASDLATWSEIQGWSLNHGIEIAHHARSHADVPWAQQNLTGLRRMLLSTIPEMKSEMPEVVADAFIQAGASGTFYQGFDTGLPAENWWEHPAGRIVLDNFPVVTSALLGQAVPLTGEPVQTIDRIGMDYGSHITAAKSRIQACYGTHLGVSIFMHPSQLTVTGRTDPTALVGMLEWLATERDAGRIEVLTVSGHAWSDPIRHTRLDIAPADKWASDTHTVTLAPLMEWVLGAQMVLEVTATTTGPLTMSVTSDTGGLSASVTHDAVAGQKYRLVISIPRTATTLTLTTPGTARACRVV